MHTSFSLGYTKDTRYKGAIMGKKKKEFDINNMTPEEELRFEIAKEIGCADKIIANGWGALSSKESGRIGGLITSRKRKQQQKH